MSLDIRPNPAFAMYIRNPDFGIRRHEDVLLEARKAPSCVAFTDEVTSARTGARMASDVERVGAWLSSKSIHKVSKS